MELPPPPPAIPPPPTVNATLPPVINLSEAPELPPPSLEVPLLETPKGPIRAYSVDNVLEPSPSQNSFVKRSSCDAAFVDPDSGEKKSKKQLKKEKKEAEKKLKENEKQKKKDDKQKEKDEKEVAKLIAKQNKVLNRKSMVKKKDSKLFDKPRCTVFESTLPEIILSQGPTEGPIPTVIVAAIAYLKRDVIIEQQGIFRQSGRQATIQTLKEVANSGAIPDLSIIKDAHTITGFLKLFLRELKLPLFPFSIYDQLIEWERQGMDQEIGDLKIILEALPKENRQLTHILLQLLQAVAKKQSINMMTELNLAIVIAPNVIRPREETLMTAMDHSPLVNQMFATMIEEVQNIFDKEEDNLKLEDIELKLECMDSMVLVYEVDTMDSAEKELVKAKLSNFLSKRPKKEDVEQIVVC